MAHAWQRGAHCYNVYEILINPAIDQEVAVTGLEFLCKKKKMHFKSLHRTTFFCGFTKCI